MTTTEGHERLERARDRFAQAAKEPGVEEPQRKRHRSEGEGSSLWRHRHQVTTRKEVAAAAVRRCRLSLRHRHLNHHLKNEVWTRKPLETDATIEQQGEPKRRREHLEVPLATDSSSSSSSSSESSTDTEMGLVDMCTILTENSEAESRCQGGPATLDLTEWDFSKADCRKKCRKVVENSRPLLLIGSPIGSASMAQPSTRRGDKKRARAVLHLAFIGVLCEVQVHGGSVFPSHTIHIPQTVGNSQQWWIS